MKFDIVRAWKDEAYRDTLSEEQLNTLPANPAGEVSDADLELASGSWGSAWGPGGFGPYVDEHASSTALLCETNIFTLNVNAAAIPLQLLSGANNNCVGSH